jgi:hypothetical protein
MYIMKKFTIFLTLCFLSVVLIAQTPPWTSGVIWDEDFGNFGDGGLPAGWTSDAFGVAAGFGQNGSNALSGLYQGNIGNFSLRTHFSPSPIVEDAYFLMCFRLISFFAVPLIFDGHRLEIRVRTATTPNHLPGTLIHTLNDDTYKIQTDWSDVLVPLDNFVGQSIAIELRAIWNPNSPNWQAYLDIDRMGIYLPHERDLSARQLYAATIPIVSVPADIRVDIFNAGSTTVMGSDYTIKLFRVGDTTPLSTVNGEEIDPHNIRTISLPVTFNVSGTSYYYAEIEYSDDQYQVNNKTPNTRINTLGASSISAYAGDPNTNNTSYTHPFDLNFYSTLSQTIYHDTDINQQGIITHLQYRYIGIGGNVDNIPVRIYLAQTDSMKFNYEILWEDPPWIDIGFPGYIPYEDFTLVYSGFVPVRERGVYDVMFELDDPFLYSFNAGEPNSHTNKKNLVVMTFIPEGRWGVGSLWQATSTIISQPYQNYRSIIARDQWGLDINDLPYGYGYELIPNLTIGFFDGLHGSVSGVVSSSVGGGTISGARITVDGSSRSDTSAANGEYQINFLPVGTVNITANSHGFFPRQETGVVITDGGNTTQNIAMIPRPTTTVTGTILASDTGTGVEGAMVILTGYERYETSTGFDGSFSIPSVYEDFEYTIQVMKEGFYTYTDLTDMITSTNNTIPAITLNERYYAPIGLVATLSGDVVNLAWSPPEHSGRWVNHGDADWAGMTVGTGYAASYILCQRFSSSQMSNLGIYGARIEKISFLPYSEADFSIVIYGGGGGNPSATTIVAGNYNPGTIIYEQPITQALNLETWNEVYLNAMVEMPLIGDLLIGIKVTNSPGYPMTLDFGPAVEGFGNVFSWNEGGSEIWTTLNTFNNFEPSLDANFNIRAYIDGVALESANSLGADDFICDVSWSRRSGGSRATISGQRVSEHLPGSYIPVDTTSSRFDDELIAYATRSFLGYNIYRLEMNDILTIGNWHHFNPTTAHSSETFTDSGFTSLPDGRYRYVVKALYINDNESRPTYSNQLNKGVNDLDVNIKPFQNRLSANFPNPFNPETSIKFTVGSMSSSTHVSINIYNIRGQKVRSLVNDIYETGEHSVVWNGTDDHGRSVGSGIYLYKMETGSFTETRKMVLIK